MLPFSFFLCVDNQTVDILKKVLNASEISVSKHAMTFYCDTVERNFYNAKKFKKNTFVCTYSINCTVIQ